MTQPDAPDAAPQGVVVPEPVDTGGLPPGVERKLTKKEAEEAAKKSS